MTDPLNPSDLSAELAHLLASGALADPLQRAADRLYKRLEARVSIVLAGPEEAAKEYLSDVLAASDLPRTRHQIVRWGDAIDFDGVDVCIWCTTVFDTEEAAQWRQAPDRLKDHSFLAAFSAYAGQGPAPDPHQTDHLQGIASEEFHRLADVTFGNRASSQQPKAVSALVTELSALVCMGLSADLDKARLFIKTHQTKAPHRAAPAPVAPAETMPTPLNKQKDAPTAALFQKALGTMRSHLATLEPYMEAESEAEFQEILTICETASAAVADVLSAGSEDEPAVVSLRDDMLSASDAILLMSTEGGAAPVVSAVTTVLQLRREMELRIAC